MSKLDALRRLIREEIRSAIREELPRLLSENSAPQKNADYKKKLRDQVSKSVTGGIPMTLNTGPMQLPKFSGNDPLSKILNETAMSMTPKDMGEEVEPETGSVNEMLSTARKSSNLEAVEIDTVPDFSEIMHRLKAKGQI